MLEGAGFNPDCIIIYVKTINHVRDITNVKFTVIDDVNYINYSYHLPYVHPYSEPSILTEITSRTLGLRTSDVGVGVLILPRHDTRHPSRIWR